LKSESTVHVKFEPLGKYVECLISSTILHCARKTGIELISICGGKGSCGHCLVQIIDGNVSPVDEEERKLLAPEMLDKGYRLACRARLQGDCRIYIPLQSLSSLQRIQVEGEEISVKLEPVATTCTVRMSSPSMEDSLADFERLRLALKEQCKISRANADITTLRQLSSTLRKNNWEVSAVIRDNEVIALLPLSFHPLGLAVDIGTTKIAFYLVDLVTGKTLAAEGMVNPQAEFGSDIITRVATAMHSPSDQERIQELVVDALNAAVLKICVDMQLDITQIVDAVIVGNTAMHHLFLRLPTAHLSMAPYVPAVSSAMNIKASELGLKFATGSYVHLLPNIAGYVGADHVAMLLSTGIYRKDGVILAIDIGTNTEICLAKNHVLTSLSCASGPAFEGAHIKHGMMVARGAIEHLRIFKHRVEYETVGNSAPVGICGSGIVDTLAQLFLAGIVDDGGRMLEHPLVKKIKGNREFIISVGSNEYPDITFTQKDVREVQLAKGAIRTGIQVLLKENRLSESDINEIIIAGAFGTYVDITSAITIGMLPDLPIEYFRQVGNAAGIGAKMALLSREKRDEAQKIANNVRYIELASFHGFKDIFAKAVNLGRFKISTKK
jgi:uncharacterized 2Fe-2S/4Fe-4S cluster protein (DUF4445 family)